MHPRRRHVARRVARHVYGVALAGVVGVIVVGADAARSVEARVLADALALAIGHPRRAGVAEVAEVLLAEDLMEAVQRAHAQPAPRRRRGRGLAACLCGQRGCGQGGRRARPRRVRSEGTSVEVVVNERGEPAAAVLHLLAPRVGPAERSSNQACLVQGGLGVAELVSRRRHSLAHGALWLAERRVHHVPVLCGERLTRREERRGATDAQRVRAEHRCALGRRIHGTELGPVAGRLTCESRV